MVTSPQPGSHQTLKMVVAVEVKSDGLLECQQCWEESSIALERSLQSCIL